MFTLRGTRRLLARMGVEPASDNAAPSTVLGDWCGNLVYVGRLQLVLAVSERTLLAVVVPAAPSASLIERLRSALADVLRAIAIDGAAIARETSAMEHVTYGKATNRQVMGTMVDLAKALPFYLGKRQSLFEVSLQLADTPCGPLYKSTVFPNRTAIVLFAETLGANVH